MHPDLTWQPLLQGLEPDSLYLNGTEVARVTQRANGDGWNGTVNMHGEVFARKPWQKFATRRIARKMAERWATANLDRIQRQVIAKSARLRRANRWSLGEASSGPP